MSSQASAVTVPSATAGTTVPGAYTMQIVGGRYEAVPTAVTDGQVRAIQISTTGVVAVSAAQSGAWTTGRTWTLASGTDSVSAVQSGAWTTGRTWVLASGTDSMSSVQSGAWNITNITGTVTLPTGASTATAQATQQTTLTSIDGKTPVLGAAAKAASVPVTMATDQPDINTKGTIDVTASGAITVINSNPNSGAATAGSTIALTALRGQITWGVQITGVYTGALTPQVTVDGVNWIALSATSITNINTNAQAATIASAAVGIFEISAPPCAQLRLTALAAVTGTATVTLIASTATGRIGLDSPVPAGTAIIGALSANQSTNVAQINGVAPLMGSGVTGTGSPRVTLASDTPSNTNAFLVSQEKSATATLTNVASSATTVVILASNAARKQATVYNDSTQILYLKFGATASTTSYTVQLGAGAYYELPGVRIYTGELDGIWASANGNARVTELT